MLCVEDGPTVTFTGTLTFIPYLTLTGDLTTIRQYLQAGAWFTVSGTALNNGVKHILEVISISDTEASLLIDETLFNETISATFSLDDYLILKRPAYSSITGLIHPDESFNVPLSPKDALINNGALIHSFLENPGAQIKYLTGEKNSALSTVLSGVTLTQNANIEVEALALPLFYPYYFEFDTEVPTNFMDIMAENPYGTIQFSDRFGRTFYGHLWDGGLKPATKDKSKWKLLCSVQTDLKQLAS
jgi:hypothetical protein